jgi:MarR family transcriptional regulator, organic hydroperoxide resistance regulator
MTAGPGQLLFTFVRHWSRRAATGDATVAEQGRLVLVTEAVHALAAVARELGIDQSGASRLIRSAVEARYLTTARGRGDGRRREVSVTDTGAAALRHAHAWQEEVFAELTAGWSGRRREDFRSAMADLLSRSDRLGT